MVVALGHIIESPSYPAAHESNEDEPSSGTSIQETQLRWFITGVAGFIGFHLADELLRQGHQVRGFDGLTPYYDPELKRARLSMLEKHGNFSWVEGMLEDRAALDRAFRDFEADVIIHLAAQAGVRYSIDYPQTYVESNLVGTFNVLEVARAVKPAHFIFASTSSVYGGNQKLPFSETDHAHFPMSLYAATKKATEAMSHSYSHLFDIPTTCVRFFTVYGPWGRPDMALFKFADRIARGEPIEVYGDGEMGRDFTYVSDLVVAIDMLAKQIPKTNTPLQVEGVADSISPVAPWRVVNIAGGQTVGLMDYIDAIEHHMGVAAEKKFLPMQPGDVTVTQADPTLLRALTGYEPRTSVLEGVGAFVAWYREYHDGK